MGDWVNKRSITAIGWITTLLMAAAGIAAIYALF
jgi:Mn2+/Fe2+ NRAMP family transporter